MKLRIDEQADALYLRLNDRPVAESEEVEAGVVLDYDADGRVVGIEVHRVSERSGVESLRSITLETSRAG